MGKNLMGVRHQLLIDPALKQYVRETHHRLDGTFIFCAFHTQLVYLTSLDAIEVDMSYKRVKGVMNEVIFATMLPEHRKIFTLCRVFTDKENPTAYKFIFQRVFELVSQAIQKPIRFESIHSEGIKAIVGDIYPNQMCGAVIKSRFIDQRDIDQFAIRERFGIHHGYHANNMETQWKNNIQREERKRLKAETEQKERERVLQDQKDQEDVDYQILFDASSSGFVKPRAKTPKPFSPRLSRSLSRSRTPASPEPNSIGLCRTATANALYEDHSNELRSLELQRRRQEIEDEREERRLKRRKIDLENQKLEEELAIIRQGRTSP
ncbi:uncharacterized protein N7498_007834 [Penicillium cinerascens]|uniref:Uncharacterized protein n=1 Tax=Penicillium cinerascens TaxID=70096 RepID=A0A9W9JML9_9EURO|nr:uncharacterized protein N7498_007834 [Penicillium cinerascens]KAJ5198717.1 hypothetical protein N7498_007834 [Penicillium cinerascens]